MSLLPKCMKAVLVGRRNDFPAYNLSLYLFQPCFDVPWHFLFMERVILDTHGPFLQSKLPDTALKAALVKFHAYIVDWVAGKLYLGCNDGI